MECDNRCGATYPNWDTESRTIEMAQSTGWGYSLGTTGNGDPYEAMICRTCRTGQHRRIIKPAQSYDDTPLWEM